MVVVGLFGCQRRHDFLFRMGRPSRGLTLGDIGTAHLYQYSYLET